MIDTVPRSLSAELDSVYADSGRPSIAPEYILRASTHPQRQEPLQLPGSPNHAAAGNAISLSRRWLVEKSFG